MFKKIIMTAVLPLFLIGCGEQLIKPEDKKVQAMLEIDMPDYQQTTENIATKIESWMKKEFDGNSDHVKFSSLNSGYVNGVGLVNCKVKNKTLKVKFDIKTESINPNLIKVTMFNFKDLPSESDSSSDLAFIFYNKVKDQALELVDSLESYLNKNTK